MASPYQARAELPPGQAGTRRRAVRLEWLTIAYLVVDVSLLLLVLGESQAVLATLVQDALELIPPIAFLVGTRVAQTASSAKHPYGFHRAISISHLVAGLSLLAFGVFLLVNSAIPLLSGQGPSIGLTQVFGVELWQGWLMIAVLTLGAVPPVLLARSKMRAARDLHNRVLYADAQMNKADWLSSAAAVVGVAGTGIGLWWADAAAAIVISADILLDGIRNIRGATSSLIDTRVSTFDDKHPHPLIDEVSDYFDELSWVARSGARIRDQGQFFHVEAFVVPEEGRSPTLDQLEEAKRECQAIDWKLQDVVVIPVREVPRELASPRGRP